MSTKKNIDRLFQEKFKDFEVTPNDAVWERISESLPKKKKKRRVIALWWQVGGVAAALVLLFTVGKLVFNPDDNNLNNNPNVVNTDNDQNSNNKEEESSKDNQIEIIGNGNLDSQKYVDSDTDKESGNKNEVSDENDRNDEQFNQLNSFNKNESNSLANSSLDNTDNNVTEKRDKLKNLTSIDEAKSNFVDNSNNNSEILDKSKINSAIDNKKNTVIADNSTSKNSLDKKENKTSTDPLEKSSLDKSAVDSVLEENKKETVEEAIASQENIDEKEKEDEQNRWSIVPNVAPVYFSSLGEGSPIDGQFNKNSKSGNINMSYGIAASYSISNKLKVRAGVNRVNLNQTTSDVFTFSSDEFAARQANGSSNRNINSNVIVMSANMLNGSTTPELFNTKSAGNIDQKFGFIEVPLELEYSVLDKKFGLNVIGGFSTFFLNQNEIYADVDGSSILIGEATNINSTSFSANFGFGLDYQLSKQWNINLEPQFKYQINTFNNTSGDFRPFFIGVYTGLNFKF